MNSVLDVALVFGGGFFAGFINTLAGNGSVITLAILTGWLGMPGNLANGTNRIGILTQSLAGAWYFSRHGKWPQPLDRTLILVTVAGSLLGVFLATRISDEGFMLAYKILMVLMFFLILLKPERWLKPAEGPSPLPLLVTYGLAFCLGVYGGFIQMGVGLFIVALMVFLRGAEILYANVVKVFIIALFSALVILVFQSNGLIDWKTGFVMASGQALGGLLSARVAVHHPEAPLWAYRMLVAAILLSLAKAFLF